LRIILGIDPGSRFTGYAVLQVPSRNSRQNLKTLDYGTLKLGVNEDFSKRLLLLNKGLEELCQKWQPHEMAIEKIFLGKNADSAFKLGHARGVCLLIGAKYNLNIIEYATRHVKKALTGSGSAEKEQVQFMVKQILNVQPQDFDSSDALALAICRAHELESQISLMPHAEKNP
jgi:crossover junction endodeoxyribonuclease RuvC